MYSGIFYSVWFNFVKMRVVINAIDHTTHQNSPWILISRLKPAGTEDGSRESRGGGTDQSRATVRIEATNVR